jgi:hypothetical protein
MANKSLIAAGAEQDRQERGTQGEGSGARPTQPMAKRVSTRRIFSTKRENDQRSPRLRKRGLALFWDSIPGPTPKTRPRAEARSEKRRFYKPLPTRFRHDGFDYRQIVRKGNAALYQQTWNGCRNRSVCYEVIRIRHREGFEIHGRFVDPAEVYPKSEAWGIGGFTVSDKDGAFVKLQEISR